jgi:hypothetical protein
MRAILRADQTVHRHYGLPLSQYHGDDVEAADRQAVQRLVDSLAAAGIDAHGEMLSATEHDVAEVIVQRARERNVVWPGSCVLALDLHPRGGTVHRRVRVLEPPGGAPRLLDPNYLAQLAKRIEPNTATSPIQRGARAEPPLEASPAVQRVQERLFRLMNG